MGSPHQKTRVATGREIRAIVGPLDDGVIAAIAALGSTPEEIAEAKAWLTSDDYLHRKLHHQLRGRAALVFDILESQLPEADGQE